LQQAVERHTEQTREQIERLGRVFETMEAKARGKTCQAMQGLIEQAQAHIEADLEPELLEVMLVSDLQKIEHFEIAAYGSARAHAEALGLDAAVELLQQTLDEEKETDELLNRIAAEEVNPQAVQGAEEEEEGEPEQVGEEGGQAQQPRRARGEDAPASGAGRGDLKSREYRDRKGNIHHHTRTSGGGRGRR
jgi:ferritin-like metal-binding protein YciE